MGWCFKFGAKNCGISIGHTFCLIDMKIGVLPIYVIRNQKNIKKIRAKSAKFGFQQVPWPRGGLR
jgi:hypothetical protein